MKKVFISLFVTLLFSAACNNVAKNQDAQTQESSQYDSLSVAVGQLLAIDCFLSNLSDYSDQINKAVDDVYAGQINKLYEAYEYVNASDMVGKSFSQIGDKLDPEIIKKVAQETLARAKDSISKFDLQTMEHKANETIMSYFDMKFVIETKRFMDDVDKMEGVQKTENGIRYKIIKSGTGKISSTDEVDVVYSLYDYNDKVIDSNETSNSPFHLTLPSGVVPGFAQAIQLVGEGGKVKAWVPAELGYGDEGSAPKISPGQTLVFVIEVVKKY